MKYHIINKLSMLLGVILIGYCGSSLATEAADKIKVQVINSSSDTLCVEKHKGSVVSNGCNGSNPYQCTQGNSIETSDDSMNNGDSSAYMYIYAYSDSEGTCNTSKIATVQVCRTGDCPGEYCYLTIQEQGSGYTFNAVPTSSGSDNSVKCTLTITGSGSD